MIRAGLTGSIGMGKSTTADLFREEGVPVYDADAAVHELYRGEAVPLIEKAFPGTTENGVVNRQKLGERVLGRADELKKLEKKYPNKLVVIGVHSAKFETEKETKNIRSESERCAIEKIETRGFPSGVYMMRSMSSGSPVIHVEKPGAAKRLFKVIDRENRSFDGKNESKSITPTC